MPDVGSAFGTDLHDPVANLLDPVVALAAAEPAAAAALEDAVARAAVELAKCRG